jgi:hypothetical protein
MALGQALLDRLLALDQPVHGCVELVLAGIGDAHVLAKRGVGPRPRHAELARLRRQDALRNHRDDQVALAPGSGIDELVEQEPPHRRAHGLDMAVGARAHHVQAILHQPELLALQDAPDRLDLVERQRRQVGQRALPDMLALAHALAQEIRRPRVAVGDRVDVHDVSES